MEEIASQGSRSERKAIGQIYLPMVRTPHGVDGSQASGLPPKPKHKDYKKNDNKANSTVVASLATVPSATTTLNNHYAALLATLATMNEEE